MSLCINPQCQNPDNPDNVNVMYCQSCGSYLLLEGRYRVMRLLGEGGFAKTYEVRDRTSIPKVLKVLTKNQSKAVEQFQREAKVLIRLNHPGIPQGEESFTFFPQNSQEPVDCLVMEKIEGENLQDWLKNRGDRPISERQAIDWLTQLANTLHEVHQQQLIHRDIKPSNIMLKPDGQLVLIDFGIAREITETYEQKLAAGQITATYTYGYAPLEQVIGRAVPQSDFFALGRTFVYLLTGKHPNEIGNNYRDPNTDDDWNWREAAPKVSDLLADFIDQLMARPIQKRPPNTQAILEQLVEIEQTLYPQRLSSSTLSNTPLIINGQNISLEYSLGGSWNSPGHSKAVSCVAISPDSQTLVSGSDDGTVKAWELKSGEQIYTSSSSGATINFIAIAIDGKILVTGGSNTYITLSELLTGKEISTINVYAQCGAISPDGQFLVSGSSGGAIQVWNLNNREHIRTLTKHSSSVRSVAISPVGKTLVSGSGDKTIRVYSSSMYTLAGHKQSVNSLTITPDGQTLVSGSDDATIKVWDMNNGKEIFTIAEHIGAVKSVAISPDGQTLASGSSDETIKLWNLNTQEEICTLDGHLDGVNAVAFSRDGRILASGGGDCTIKVWRIQS
jgi:WD40 repeat protein/predicted Ser/Thr protein kinase